MDEQLVETWRIHTRINLHLLEPIAPEGLEGVPTGMSGRSVGQIFAHLHNVRLMWLEVSSPDLLRESPLWSSGLIRKAALNERPELPKILHDNCRQVSRRSTEGIVAHFG